MSHCVKRTRFAVGTLLLGTLLLASSPVTALSQAPQASQASRTPAGPRGETTGLVAASSVLDRFQELLRLFGARRRGAPRPGARPAPRLRTLEGGAGCGIDPNGIYHCT